MNSCASLNIPCLESTGEVVGDLARLEDLDGDHHAHGDDELAGHAELEDVLVADTTRLLGQGVAVVRVRFGREEV